MYSILPESNIEPENIWMFPKIGVPQNGWFIMKNPIKMDDLGVPLFLETPIWPFFSGANVGFGGVYACGLTNNLWLGRFGPF